jgi:hypothetical protein
MERFRSTIQPLSAALRCRTWDAMAEEIAVAVSNRS